MYHRRSAFGVRSLWRKLFRSPDASRVLDIRRLKALMASFEGAHRFVQRLLKRPPNGHGLATDFICVVRSDRSREIFQTQSAAL